MRSLRSPPFNIRSWLYTYNFVNTKSRYFAKFATSSLSEGFQLNVFALNCCDLKIKLFYTYLQNYRITQMISPNCNDFQILLDCIVITGILNKYYNITVSCSISCVSFLGLSKWFGKWHQTWNFTPRSGVFNALLDFSSEDLIFLGFNCVAEVLRLSMIFCTSCFWSHISLSCYIKITWYSA